MKISKNYLLFLLILFFFSCDSTPQDSNTLSVEDSVELEIDEKISGELTSNFKVISGTFKKSSNAYKNKLLVEIERSSSDFIFELSDAQLCGISEGKLFTYCINADIFDASGKEAVKNLQMYGYSSFKKAMQLKAEEKVFLEFAINSKDLKLLEKVNSQYKVKVNSNLEKNETSYAHNTNFSRNDWDDVLDEYEAYVNEYITLIDKAKNGDAGAISQYAKLLQKSESLSRKLQKSKDELTPNQIDRMMKVQMSIMKAPQGF